MDAGLAAGAPRRWRDGGAPAGVPGDGEAAGGDDRRLARHARGVSRVLRGSAHRQGGGAEWSRRQMKGVILAGGTGSRLYPLTRITNKHLLPVYDRPMIFYPIETLVKAGIDEVMVVTGGNHAGEFLPLLGNGSEFGLRRLQFSYQADRKSV